MFAVNAAVVSSLTYLKVVYMCPACMFDITMFGITMAKMPVMVMAKTPGM